MGRLAPRPFRRDLAAYLPVVNEAEFVNYAGLHQWNIDYRGGQLTISSKTDLFEIPRGIHLSASLSVPIYDPKSRWLKAVLRKPLEE
jgi:hypothetical protein